MIDFAPVLSAFQEVRRELLAKRETVGPCSGCWLGNLGSSAIASATAASALCIVANESDDESKSEAYRSLATKTVHWLAGCQNDDGGWGDTRTSPSRLATTMLVRACFHLAGATQTHSSALERAAKFVKDQGGLRKLRKECGRDKSQLALILTNCALAGLEPWSDVPALAFELSWLPLPMRRVLGLSTAGHAGPAVVASGQARYFHRQPRNPLAWMVRRLSVRSSMRMLQWMQPPSGGFFEAVPLTSFVVMSLASTGRLDHAVTRRGVGFLLDAVRADASWPIDTNFAVRNTSLAVSALASASGDVGALGCTDWLISCQQRDPNPLTRAAPGGWSWNASTGAAPSSGDTAWALLALAMMRKSGGHAMGHTSDDTGEQSTATAERLPVDDAMERGLEWLLDVQNDDGGWPMFSRGQRNLPLEQSAPDNTALAVRALHACRESVVASEDPSRLEAAIRRGLEFLSDAQHRDGSWSSVNFGNSSWPRDENPVCGTALVLFAYRDLGQMDQAAAVQGLQWLAANVDPGGGWGGGRGLAAGPVSMGASSVEETALALEALLASESDERFRPLIEENLQWLVKAVHDGRHRESAPIGMHLTGLWYDERLYPLAFTVAALGQAVRRMGSRLTN